MKSYILKEKDGKLVYSESLLVDDPKALKVIDHPIRLKILKILAKGAKYPAEIAKEIKMHEQKVYYHINKMMETGILEITEKKEIRGTTAKSLSPRLLGFSFSLSNKWDALEKLIEKRDKEITEFLHPFINEGEFNATIVVGSPDAHGPHKARARDGHYAIDLSLFLGNFCTLGKDFATSLDVDVNLEERKNFILVGGPVTNLLVAKINEHLPVKFSDKKPWGIISNKNTYTEESIGLISKIENPFSPGFYIMVIAGIRFIGTKAGVIAFTRHTKDVIYRYTGQKKFHAVVQGFDLDGDGKIDSVDVLE